LGGEQLRQRPRLILAGDDDRHANSPGRFRRRARWSATLRLRREATLTSLAKDTVESRAGAEAIAPAPANAVGRHPVGSGGCQARQWAANCFTAPLLTTIARGRKTVAYIVSRAIVSRRAR